MVGGSLPSVVQGTRSFHLVIIPPSACDLYGHFKRWHPADRERTWRIVWRDPHKLDLEVMHISSAHIFSIQLNSVRWPHPTAREASNAVLCRRKRGTGLMTDPAKVLSQHQALGFYNYGDRTDTGILKLSCLMPMSSCLLFMLNIFLLKVFCWRYIV